MTLDFTHGHAAGIERQYLVVKAYLHPLQAMPGWSLACRFGLADDQSDLRQCEFAPRKKAFSSKTTTLPVRTVCIKNAACRSDGAASDFLKAVIF